MTILCQKLRCHLQPMSAGGGLIGCSIHLASIESCCNDTTMFIIVTLTFPHLIYSECSWSCLVCNTYTQAGGFGGKFTINLNPQIGGYGLLVSISVICVCVLVSYVVIGVVDVYYSVWLRVKSILWQMRSWFGRIDGLVCIGLVGCVTVDGHSDLKGQNAIYKLQTIPLISSLKLRCLMNHGYTTLHCECHGLKGSKSVDSIITHRPTNK